MGERGGVGIGVTYAYTSSSTGAPTGPTAIASGGKINVTGTGPWTFTVTASNTSGNASGVTTASAIYPYPTFSTIANQAYSQVTVLPTFNVGSTYTAQNTSSVAVNVSQTRMLFTNCSNTGGVAYYSTYSGGSWSTPTLVPNSTLSYISGNVGNICVLSPDGTKGAIWGNGGFVSVDWSGATPVGTVITTSMPFSRGGLSISMDGTFIVASCNTSIIYYTTWQTASSKFAVPLQIGSLTAPHISCAISQDKSVIMVRDGSTKFGYITVTWAGSTPTFSSTTAWTYITMANADDAWSFQFAGGNQNSPSTNIITMSYNGGKINIYTWNNSTKTATYQFTFNEPTTYGWEQSFTCIAGTNGNILYQPNLNGTNFFVTTITLSVS